MRSRAASILGWILFGLLAALVIFSGVAKFLPVDPASEQAAMMLQMGMTPDLVFGLGVTELVIAVLFLIPRTSLVGYVLMVGYFGGVLATGLTHAQPTMPFYVILAVIALCGYLRFPELSQRLHGKA